MLRETCTVIPIGSANRPIVFAFTKPGLTIISRGHTRKEASYPCRPLSPDKSFEACFSTVAHREHRTRVRGVCDSPTKKSKCSCFSNALIATGDSPNPRLPRLDEHSINFHIGRYHSQLCSLLRAIHGFNPLRYDHFYDCARQNYFILHDSLVKEENAVLILFKVYCKELQLTIKE